MYVCECFFAKVNQLLSAQRVFRFEEHEEVKVFSGAALVEADSSTTAQHGVIDDSSVGV